MVKIFKHQDEPGWFLADETGVILIDGCADLDAATSARRNLLARLDDSLNKVKQIEADNANPSWQRLIRSLAVC